MKPAHDDTRLESKEDALRALLGSAAYEAARSLRKTAGLDVGFWESSRPLASEPAKTALSRLLALFTEHSTDELGEELTRVRRIVLAPDIQLRPSNLRSLVADLAEAAFHFLSPADPRLGQAAGLAVHMSWEDDDLQRVERLLAALRKRVQDVPESNRRNLEFRVENIQGGLHQQADDYPAALECFRRACGLAATTEERLVSQLNRAQDALRLGHTEEASVAFREAIRLDSALERLQAGPVASIVNSVPEVALARLDTAVSHALHEALEANGRSLSETKRKAVVTACAKLRAASGSRGER